MARSKPLPYRLAIPQLEMVAMTGFEPVTPRIMSAML